MCNCGVCDACAIAMNDFLEESLCLAQESCIEIGTVVKFILRNETDISRDDYNTITDYKKALTKEYEICAMNITYNPDNQELTRAGLYETSEVTISTPTKCWIDNGLVYNDIDIKKTTVVLGGEVYKIQEKGREQIITGTTPLFYTFGLVKN